MSERRYDDREVAQILKRVAELHEADGASGGDGMTAQELEGVVGELGMSKALVARATMELARPQARTQPRALLGGPESLMFEDRVDGEISDATFELMVDVLRRALGVPGEVDRSGDTRMWSSSEGAGRVVHLTLVPREGYCVVRLDEQMPVDARTTVGMGTVAGGMSGMMSVVPMKVLLAAGLAKLFLLPMVVVGGLAGWGIGRAVWRRRSQGREAELSEAFAQVMDHARAGVRRALGEG